MPKYILASNSPRRKQLLEWAEINFTTIIPYTDESFPDNLLPSKIAIHIAQQKALAIESKGLMEKIIIAADTIVVYKDEIIGKPKNRQEAISILSKLSGKHHQVITGVVIKSLNKEVNFFDSTDVEFYNLSNEQIQYYVDKYKPFDKAGAYAIQEWIGIVGIKRIEGDFYNVMGLPISRVVQALKEFD